jgi:hypothetical protein
MMAAAAGRLAYTGADIVPPAVASLVLLVLGAATLPVAGVVRRRATPRR